MELNNEICISLLQGSGWMRNHDETIKNGIIDNEKCVFTGYKTDEKNNKYPRFWESGGSCWFDNDWNDYCNECEWEIYEDKIPKKYRGYAKDIDFIFNTNVKHGCCGGCL